MKRMAWIYWGAVALVLLIVGLFWIFDWHYKEYTNDAYVEGNQVYITPLIPGFIQSIHTDDTFLVKRGQLLVQMDETDSIIALNKAKDDLAQMVRQVCQMFHDVFAYEAEIEVKRAEYIVAAQDFEHRQNVLDAGGVSLEDWEHAVAALRASYYSLNRAEILYEKALSLVQGTSLRDHPLILAASDKVRDAWVQLYRCRIYAPVEGLVAQRTIQVGMWIPAGHPLMSVIPLDQIWVNANFKETQLKRIRIGQKVKIHSDLWGWDVIFNGKVVGLPGAAGNAFSLLPPQNLSGNWIKIVQRLPVRVELDPEELKKHPLRIGLSMEATVNLRNQKGLYVPTSSKGSPLYETPIFEIEEKGDEKLIREIIRENLDMTLARFESTPLQLSSYRTLKPSTLSE
ncbi:MAG: efflux RND transporter periplasmic adaptor subunit [Verrucomicrobia bacterium]|nr:efflux RND transporter periplasmic adaptor subunit [Verrucomicrobiota bacterium]